MHPKDNHCKIDMVETFCDTIDTECVGKLCHRSDTVSEAQAGDDIAWEVKAIANGIAHVMFDSACKTFGVRNVILSWTK